MIRLKILWGRSLKNPLNPQYDLENTCWEKLNLFADLFMENSRKKEKYKINEEQEERNDETFSHIKANENSEMKSSCKLLTPFSTFQCTPLVVAAKVFLFLPLDNSLNAENFKNSFLLKTAIKHLDMFEAVGVTYDVSKCDDKVLDDIKCGKIKRKISYLHFTGMTNINSMVWLENLSKIKATNRFENIQKISFQGKISHRVYYEKWYSNLFIEAVLQLIKKCRNLKHFEFVYVYYGAYLEEEDKKEIKKLFEKLKPIDKITLKYYDNDKIFECIR